MKESPSSGAEKNSDRFSKSRRREFMVRQFRAKGVLSLSRLNYECKVAPSTAMIEKDIEALNQMGFSITPVESEGRTYLVDASARHLGSKAERMGLHSEEKQDIAIAAASLVFGLPDDDKVTNLGISGAASKRCSLVSTNPEIAHWWSRGQVYNALVTSNSASNAEPKATEIMKQLELLWEEGVLSMFCDAGTTNERLGLLLRDVLIPTSFSALNNLSLCTNSRSIFNTVADPEVSTKAICMGGSQMGVDGVTEALAGPLTDTFLTATASMLNFGFVFLGTTAIDVGAGFILSDSHEEKSIKGMVLSRARSTIRAICADRTKISGRPSRSGYRFCSISPSEVDVIITNAKYPTDPAEDESTLLINEIRQRGVPVIEAKFQTNKEAVPEMQRGQLFRSRLPFHKAETLFQMLGFDLREDIPFKSRAMEIWLNAATDYFLQQATEKEKTSLRERVGAMLDKTYLGCLKKRTTTFRDAPPPPKSE